MRPEPTPGVKSHSSFGTVMSGRTWSAGNGYKYGFNGSENFAPQELNEINFFEYRLFNSALGRFTSLDPKFIEFPQFSAYCFVANSPLIAIDPEGADIIILSAPNNVQGLGHAAVLIGSEKTGWRLYSKNGTTWSSGASGPSNKHPENGIPFKSLYEFANSSSNFDENGEQQYLSGFRIESSPEIDIKMMDAASETVSDPYYVIGNSCIDVCSDALRAGGFDPGTETYTDGRGCEHKSMDAIPNHRYETITENNIGSDVSKELIPRPEVENQKKIESKTSHEIPEKK